MGSLDAYIEWYGQYLWYFIYGPLGNPKTPGLKISKNLKNRWNSHPLTLYNLLSCVKEASNGMKVIGPRGGRETPLKGSAQISWK